MRGFPGGRRQSSQATADLNVFNDMPEGRHSPRVRTFKGGSIIFGAAAAIDCVVRNMSETGAALEVESPVGIPDEFMLFIKPERVKRQCRVAWRSAKRIGVKFDADLRRSTKLP